jgi:serine protease
MRVKAVFAALLVLFVLVGRTVAQAPPTPNDPLYARQGYLVAADVPAAWATTTGDPGVVIAIADTGIDIAHPDLAANIWTLPTPGALGCGNDLHGCNLLDPASAAKSCHDSAPAMTPDIAPLSPRGTFLAGIVAAAGNNGQGITGVLWRASLLPVRVADCRGETDEATLAAGIRYAAKAGARVILVGPEAKRSQTGGCRPPLLALAQAVQDARDAGALVVAGTGDDNTDCVSDPAAAPGALAVGGATADGSRWTDRKYGSNGGPQVAVVAPAANIVSTVPLVTGKAPPDDRYAISSGTTYAAAIVAGEAGLLLSVNPALTPDWLVTLITRSARPLPDGATPGWSGAGMVDAAAALELVPAAFRGAVTLGGVPAPDGTLVEAYVGDTLCAETAAFFDGSATTYALFVPVVAMQPGCGAPGQVVDLRVDGVSVASAPWSAAATSLDLDSAAGE